MKCVHNWQQLNTVLRDEWFFCTKCLAQAKVSVLMGGGKELMVEIREVNKI